MGRGFRPVLSKTLIPSILFVKDYFRLFLNFLYFLTIPGTSKLSTILCVCVCARMRVRLHMRVRVYHFGLAHLLAGEQF
jgi:hypothetical protein